MTLESVLTIAEKGTHCGMCKIDFLGSGLCPAGKKHGFLAYWPQGRMEIVKALAAGTLQPTEKLVDIVNACPLCGMCDKQCNFITQLRPEKVAAALKEYVNTLDPKKLKKTSADETVKALQQIVGEQWATNDPVIQTAYVKSIIPPHTPLNYYVVMPKTTQEVAQIIKYANKHNIPYMPRSGGTMLSYTLTTVLSTAIGLEHGIIIDLLRLNHLDVDPANQIATVGAGITAFDLQKEAYKHELRVNVAEAGAHICANLASTGICTTWGNTYGWATDNYIDVELVDEEGNILHQSDIDIKNPYSAEHGLTSIKLTPPGIVTSATVKLYPVFKDEDAVMVPFENLADAVDFGSYLAKRDIGLSLVIMSRKYLSEFISPTQKIANDFEYIAEHYMKLNYVVAIVCHKLDRKIIEDMVDVIIDSAMMKTLILGSPRFSKLKESEFLKILSEEENPLKALFTGPIREHLIKALDASPAQIAQVFDPDLRDFFTKIYAQPHMTNVVWLHAFRILPSRLLRQRMFIPRGGVLKADKKIILGFVDMLSEVGKKYHHEHALGYINFFEHGKFCVLEYDYYYDHNNPEATKRVNKAILETLERTLMMDGIIGDLHFYFKGLFRKEHILYPIPKAISKDEQLLFKELIGSILGE
ncbi:MAG: FAD-binding protein [Candidatus Thermoplasmatota archaeon]|nr:FAD-binding protein [Candidatus Thermoplasmatota archaeon]